MDRSSFIPRCGDRLEIDFSRCSAPFAQERQRQYGTEDDDKRRQEAKPDDVYAMAHVWISRQGTRT